MKINELSLKKDIIGSISNNIIEYFESNGVFEQLPGDRQRNINRNHYFICMLLSNIITFVPVFILSLLLGSEWFIKAFWLTIYYRLLRWQLGGFHFNNANLCLWFSSIILVVLTYLSLILIIPESIAWLLLLIAVLFIIYLGPQLPTEQVTLKENEKITAQRIGLVILMTYMLIFLITKDTTIVIATSFLIIMVIGAYVKRERYQ